MSGTHHHCHCVGLIDKTSAQAFALTLNLLQGPGKTIAKVYQHENEGPWMDSLVREGGSQHSAMSI